MSAPENTLIVSLKEKGSELIPYLEKEGITVRFSAIKLVDFIIAGKIAIVRRTIDEFVADLRNKMIYRTAIEFKRDFADPLYIIEGKEFTANGSASVTMRAGIAYLTVLNRIPIIFTSSMEETSKYLSLMLKQSEYASERDTSVVEDRKDKTESSISYQVEVLTHFPGITEADAKALLEKFGSLKAIFGASENELQSTKSFGMKKAKSFLKAKAASIELD